MATARARKVAAKKAPAKRKSVPAKKAVAKPSAVGEVSLSAGAPQAEFVVHISVEMVPAGAAPPASPTVTIAATALPAPAGAPHAVAPTAVPQSAAREAMPGRGAGPGRAEASIEKLTTRLAAVAKGVTGADLVATPIRFERSMDPRLQLAVANHRSGKPGTVQSSVGADEIAVIARVKSVSDWENIPDVIPGSSLGKSDDTFVVTGRLPIARIEAVRTDPTVVSLKASQPVHEALAATVAAMGVEPAKLPKGSKPHGGAGMVVGIVDFGCDFAHRNFLDAKGRTRIEAIWNQAGVPPAGPTPFKYGRLYSAAQINAALKAANPYAALGYGPAVDSGPEQGTHGTHVMDIAAGNGRGSGVAGVAPEATIIFVEAAASDIAWDGAQSVGQTFGDSVQMLEAVRFIFDQAGDRPCVVNLSLGTNGGPHDGTSLVEKGLDAIVEERPNRAVVIAASNSFADHIHASGRVAGTGTEGIEWDLPGGSGAEFELWYPGARRLEMTVISPDGHSFGPVTPGQPLQFNSGAEIALFLSSRLKDPNNGDNVLGIWVAANMPSGRWKVQLRSVDGQPVPYHAWIERRDGAQAQFVRFDDSHTLGSISTGHDTIVVGCYEGHKPAFPISYFSSAGPTRDGRQKPELSAPGQAVWAAWSRTKTGTTRKSGTSMAAPAVTGLVALIYAEAARKGQKLTVAQLRQKLQQGLVPPPAAGAWDARYGSGRATGKSV